jgi:peptide/nickel transport system permease protein
VQGYIRIGQDFGGFIIRMILPSITLSVGFIALIARITRASVLEVLNEDYIRTARAKGLSNRVVLMRHALRNAAVPILTVIGLGIAILIGGAVVTESVFGARPPHRRSRAEPRLPDHPDGDPAVLRRLRRRQPADRHQLHHLRSEDPLLSAITPEVVVDSASIAAASTKRKSLWRLAIRNSNVIVGGTILIVMLIVAILAPFLGTVDPTRIDPAARNKKPDTVITYKLEDGTQAKRTVIMGTDSLGRDVYSRVLYGTRVSLAVGICVALCAIAIGVVIGLVSGYVRWADGIIMRVMDGLMAIPGILLAIALVSIWRAGLITVIFAIVVPDVPRVVRLVRSIVLTVREEPYVEGAISVGTPTWTLMFRHILPNTVAPLIVQGTFIAAAAILAEAALSFLGIGIPPEIPSWGNIMAEGRTLFRVFPHNILYPGIFLAITVLAINIVGDGLRDTLDPKMSKKV